MEPDGTLGLDTSIIDMDDMTMASLAKMRHTVGMTSSRCFCKASDALTRSPIPRMGLQDVKAAPENLPCQASECYKERLYDGGTVLSLPR
jgi:hypothetical protein